MKIKKYVPLFGVAFLWIAICLCCLFGPEKEISFAERRTLAKFPELSTTTVSNGLFMQKFADYSRDQFPMRDSVRSMKALFHYYVLGQKENNDIYYYDGYAGELQYPLNEDSVDYAIDRFQFLYDRYLQDSDGNIYVSVVPDKAYYFSENSGYPRMNYSALFRQVEARMSWSKYIDISDVLDLSSYYKTDIHWSQSSLGPVAMLLAEEMGLGWQESFWPTLGTDSFLGVYYGQAALPMTPEPLYIMENDTLNNCTVLNFESGKFSQIYDLEKLSGRDPYEVYLSGSVSLLTIENPCKKDGNELILFRDSFGSSLAPWLVQFYSKITLVDIRYIAPQMLDRYIDFHGQDVLFLYSVPVLNHSNTLK